MNYELILKFRQASDALSAELLAAVLDRFVAGKPLSAIEALLQDRSGCAAGAGPVPNAAQKSGTTALALRPGTLHAASDGAALGVAISAGAEGQAQAEISISFEIKEELFRELCERAFALAEILGMEIFDPQLSRMTSAPEMDRIAEKWGEMRTYVLRSRGLDALLLKNEPLMLPPPTFLERHWKMVLLGVALLFALLFIQRSVQLLR